MNIPGISLKKIDPQENWIDILFKDGFSSESATRFSNLQTSKKNIFQKTILSLKFKFQVQDSFLEYFYWRFEKHIAPSEKKPPLGLSTFPVASPFLF